MELQHETIDVKTTNMNEEVLFVLSWNPLRGWRLISVSSIPDLSAKWKDRNLVDVQFSTSFKATF